MQCGLSIMHSIYLIIPSIHEIYFSGKGSLFRFYDLSFILYISSVHLFRCEAASLTTTCMKKIMQEISLCLVCFKKMTEHDTAWPMG